MMNETAPRRKVIGASCLPDLLAFSPELSKAVKTSDRCSMLRMIWKEIKFWISELLLSFLLCLYTSLIARWLGLTDEMLRDTLHPKPSAYFILVFFIVVAYLYFLRVFRRIAYGFAEIEFACIGFGIAVDRAANSFDNGTFMLAAAGSVYIAVRGLDNTVAGIKERYRDEA